MAKIICRYCKHEKANLTASCAYCNMDIDKKVKWNPPNSSKKTILSIFNNKKKKVNSNG